jgi:Domain of unknown function (DUF4375)
MSDHRISRGAVRGDDEFDLLQALHEAAFECLYDGRPDELTPGMRAVTVLFTLTGDVENGGFSAALYNGSARWTADAIEAAKLVGADGHAEVLERFTRLALAGATDLSQEALNDRLEAMDEREEAALEELDNAFFALPSIEGPLGGHVRAHPEQYFRD